MGTNESRPVRERIQDKHGDFGHKQRLVAELVLANPSTVLFATAGELAAKADVDPATVVRFAQGLGYRGFPELREALRAEFPMLRSAPQLIEDEIPHIGGQEFADLERVIARGRDRSLANLAATYDRLSPEVLNEAVSLLLNAKRIIVIGAGQSEILALHLQRLLQLAGLSVQLLRDWFDLLYSVSSFAAGDVIFATTVWHYSTVTVQTVGEARRAGANVVLLTDEAFSPAAAHADIVLFYAPRAVGEYLSPLGGVAVIDAIAAIIAARVPGRVKRGMELQTSISVGNGLSID